MGMERDMPVPERRVAIHRSDRARTMTGVLRVATVVLIAGILWQRGVVRDVPVVQACGLASTPTMLANSVPALLFPSAGAPAGHPVGQFGTPYVAGQTIHFGEDLSHVTNGYTPDVFRWRWNFGDGTAYSYDQSPTHVFATPGTYDVTSELYDLETNNWTFEDSAQIEIIATAPQNPPIAHITASATAVALGSTVSYDGSTSQAGADPHLTYLWNFGDGATATGPRVRHTFQVTGSGFVALIVTDGRGVRALATQPILVVPELPVARVSASYTTIIPGASITFDASRSTPPGTPAGDVLTTFNWNFGDGSSASGASPTVTHTFQAAGRYTVTVQAVDQQGAPGTARVVVTVVPSATTSSSGSWPLFGSLAVVLVLGGAFAIRAQRRRAAFIRQRQAAMELARARRVQPVRARGALPRPAPRVIDASVAPGPPMEPRLPRPITPTQQARSRGGPTPGSDTGHTADQPPDQRAENDDWLR
jgi:PKD repeat protein